MRMIYVDLGLYYPSLDGTHIQTETSEEQDSGQDKEIENGIDLICFNHGYLLYHRGIWPIHSPLLLNILLSSPWQKSSSATSSRRSSTKKKNPWN